MIQRIQHLYFLLIGAIAVWFCISPILTFEIEGATIITKNISARNIEVTGQGLPMLVDEYWSLFIVLISIAIISLVAIFLYNNRKLQEIFGYLNYVLIVIFVVLFLKIFFENIDADSFPINAINSLSMFKLILMFGSLVLNFMAIKGINDDNELLKSADRIR